jgi:RNA polymerase sigma-70 factor (ECF subfamily)
MALAGRANTVKVALIDGTPGAVWAPRGRPRVVFAFRVIGNTISEIEIVMDPAVVAALQVQVL